MPGNTRFLPYNKPQPKPEILSQKLVVELKNPEGESLGPPLSIPSEVTPLQLQLLVKELLKTTQNNHDDNHLDFAFFVDNNEIIKSVQEDVIESLKYSPESIITIVYQPQSFFKVKPVTRCSSTLTGHQEAILSVCFSPDGSQLATGSGDCTVRIWDMNTETPKWTLKGHSNWVQVLAWSPDNQILSSGSMDSTIRLWNPKTGKMIGDQSLKAHTASITAIAWEPFKDNSECRRFASSSRDNTIRIWDAITRKPLFTLSQHAHPVMCLRWGGESNIFSGSRDKTIKVWSTITGKCLKTLEGHAHWVNNISLSTEFALRTGPYDHTRQKYLTKEASQEGAIERYKSLKGNNPEYLVSCSDDFTLFLWNPILSKPIMRMTGHQQLVNHVTFSPDGRWLASAGFDKSVKLWEGRTGIFVETLRGHVGAVYQVAFSPDSRMLLSASKDSTCKVWNMRTKKLSEDLPGHADEVFAVDWNPNGSGGASGGKDKTLKM